MNFDICMPIRVHAQAFKVKRPKRKKTSMIVFHRNSVGRDVDECVSWFLKSAEGVATSTVSPANITHALLDQWVRDGIPSSNIERAFVPYNLMIDKSGEIVETCDVDAVGAHCAGVNSYSIGIGVVGDFREYPPTSSQIDSMKYIVHYLKARYDERLEVFTHDQIREKQGKPLKQCAGKLLRLSQIFE